jgi:hypothetical protein
VTIFNADPVVVTDFGTPSESPRRIDPPRPNTNREKRTAMSEDQRNLLHHGVIDINGNAVPRHEPAAHDVRRIIDQILERANEPQQDTTTNNSEPD